MILRKVNFKEQHLWFIEYRNVSEKSFKLSDNSINLEQKIRTLRQVSKLCPISHINSERLSTNRNKPVKKLSNSTPRMIEK